MSANTVKQIRRFNLLYLVSQAGGRLEFAERLGYENANYINQLIGGFINIGPTTGRKIETAGEVTPGWLNEAHPNLWTETFGEDWKKQMREAGVDPDVFVESAKVDLEEINLSALDNNGIANLLEGLARVLRKK